MRSVRILYILYIVTRARVRSQQKPIDILQKTRYTICILRRFLQRSGFMLDKVLKIDAHVHSSGISLCSAVNYKQIVEEKKKLGYDGIILTNHCQKWYYPPEEHAAFIERLITEYREAAAYAKTQDFKVWLGIEVTLHEPHYADWLLYGVTEEFLRATPCLYQLKQKELFELCEKWGVWMVQAHAFREGHSPCNPAYMHGIEINCNERDIGNVTLIEEFAAKHKLLITCGVDYHQLWHDYVGGMFVGADCRSSADFVKEIVKNGKTSIFLQETEKEYPIFPKK